MAGVRVVKPDPEAHVLALTALEEPPPTVLEALFWGWLAGFPGASRIYFEELEITDLVGDGNEPDDFVGVL